MSVSIADRDARGGGEGEEAEARGTTFVGARRTYWRLRSGALPSPRGDAWRGDVII